MVVCARKQKRAADPKIRRPSCGAAPKRTACGTPRAPHLLSYSRVANLLSPRFPAELPTPHAGGASDRLPARAALAARLARASVPTNDRSLLIMPQPDVIRKLSRQEPPAQRP